MYERNSYNYIIRRYLTLLLKTLCNRTSRLFEILHKIQSRYNMFWLRELRIRLRAPSSVNLYYCKSLLNLLKPCHISYLEDLMSIKLKSIQLLLAYMSIRQIIYLDPYYKANLRKNTDPSTASAFSSMRIFTQNYSLTSE